MQEEMRKNKLFKGMVIKNEYNRTCKGYIIAVS